MKVIIDDYDEIDEHQPEYIILGFNIEHHCYKYDKTFTINDMTYYGYNKINDEFDNCEQCGTPTVGNYCESCSDEMWRACRPCFSK